VKVSELIEHLQSLDNEELVVYLKISDDDDTCYEELVEEEIIVDTVRDNAADSESEACIIGERRWR